LHALGIFNGYYFDFDESVYAGRAWSFLTTGQFEISPYPYSYDHPFVGYIILAFWYMIFPSLYGLTVIGRIYIAIEFGITLGLLYAINKKYFSRRIGIYSLIFAGFQMGFFEMQSKINLDNIGTMIVLLSLLTFLPTPTKWLESIRKSRDIIGPNKLSAVFFGLAILTKLPMMVFTPAFCFFYISFVIKNIYNQDSTIDRFHKRQILKSFFWRMVRNLIYWLLIVILTISIWFIYALFTDDFTTLILKTQSQMLRTSDLGLNWVIMDVMFNIRIAKMLVFAFVGIGIILISVKIWKFKQSNQHIETIKITFTLSQREGKLIDVLSIMGFAGMFMFFLVIFGTCVNHWIPFFIFGSWLIAASIDTLTDLFHNYIHQNMHKIDSINRSNYILKKNILGLSFLIIFCGMLIAPFGSADILMDRSGNQRDALQWIETNLPKDSTIILQDYFFIELKQAGFENVHPFLYLQSANPPDFDFYINPDLRVFDLIDESVSVFGKFDEKMGPIVIIYINNSWT
jgi:hypothetical protein